MDKLDHILLGARSIQPPKSVPRPPIDPALWEAAVGSRIARRTQPLRLERGVLSVRVATAAWANELSLLSADILALLVARGIEATQLRFSVGDIQQPPRRRGKPRRAAPPDAALPETLRERVAAIADDDLKHALSEAAAKSLEVVKRNR